MATINKSMIASRHYNKYFIASGEHSVTSMDECAEVQLFFKEDSALSGGMSFIVNIIPNVLINPETLEFAASFFAGYSGTTYDTSFAPPIAGRFAVSPIITIPPGYNFNIVDASGGAISCGIAGTIFKNYAN